MLFSCSCWHVEDHGLYSASFLHAGGEARRLYAVPARAAAAFERAFRATLPDHFAVQPDLLMQLVTMVSPRSLQAAGVPVYAVTQEPGEFVVTWPGVYTAAVDLGLNVSESVNFATADWLRHAGRAEQRYRLYRRPPVGNRGEGV